MATGKILTVHHPCMVYLSLFADTWLMFMVNVGKCTIHGLFGLLIFRNAG